MALSNHFSLRFLSCHYHPVVLAFGITTVAHQALWLQRATSSNLPVSPGRGDYPGVNRPYEDIQEAIQLECAGRSFKYKELFTGGKMQNFRRILICITVDEFPQLSGINLITYYVSVIFQSIGLGRNPSLLIAGFNATEYLLASFIPIWIIEKVGRAN
jgi:hypothetical protein